MIHGLRGVPSKASTEKFGKTERFQITTCFSEIKLGGRLRGFGVGGAGEGGKHIVGVAVGEFAAK